MRMSKASGLIIAMLLITALSHAQAVVDGFAARTFRTESGAGLSYRLFVPAPAMAVRSKRLPIVVYLHGVAGAGNDNLMQITGGNTQGTHLWTAPSMQARHPAFIIAPQIPVGNAWGASGPDLSRNAELVIELIANLSREFSIDPDRVYLIGQSLGGFGVWDLIAKRPDFFAAAVPLCGGGNPARIMAARRVPIWAFHGAKDEVVAVVRSREMVAALRTAGSSIKYTEYPNTGHDVWTQAFSEPTLPQWLFAQQRVQLPPTATSKPLMIRITKASEKATPDNRVNPLSQNVNKNALGRFLFTNTEIRYHTKTPKLCIYRHLHAIDGRLSDINGR